MLTAHGFNATFFASSGGCGGLFSSDTGSIVSPGYGIGVQSYDPKSDCEYLIRVDDNFDIELVVNDLHLPDDSGNCSNTYLAIYDGPDERSNKLMTLCGVLTSNVTMVRSTNNEVYMRFKADGKSTGLGFNVTYSKVCGKTITLKDDEQTKVITSPEYPHITYNAKACSFIIKADQLDKKLTLRFAFLDGYNMVFDTHGFKPSNYCSSSYVEVFEGQTQLESKRIARLCNAVSTLPIVSSGNSLTLNTRFSVFKAIVSSIASFCGGDFDLTEGFVSSPVRIEMWFQMVTIFLCTGLSKQLPTQY